MYINVAQEIEVRLDILTFSPCGTISACSEEFGVGQEVPGRITGKGFWTGLTGRCHKREFLFNLVKDRRRWLQWLYKAKKRYGLTILDYTVTSNHIHMLLYDDGGRDVIP